MFEVKHRLEYVVWGLKGLTLIQSGGKNDAVRLLCDVVYCIAWSHLCTPAPKVKYLKQTVYASWTALPKVDEKNRLRWKKNFSLLVDLLKADKDMN